MSYKKRTVKVEQTETYCVCDKCGKELLDDGVEYGDEHERLSMLAPFGVKTVYRNRIVQNVCRIYPGGQPKEDVKVYNLCNDCIKQLEVWLKS